MRGNKCNVTNNKEITHFRFKLTIKMVLMLNVAYILTKSYGKERFLNRKLLELVDF